jgi:hypothetical protein
MALEESLSMRIWTQNLNERDGKTGGSILWHGRGSIGPRGNNWRKPEFGAEWLFFHKVGWRFGVGFDTGHGDGNDGFMFHFSLQWLCSLYLYLDGVYPVKHGRCFDFYIADRSIKLTPWGREMEWNSKDPWWINGWRWDFPWAHQWIYTKVLNHAGEVVWQEHRRDRRTRNKSDPFASTRDRMAIEQENSIDYPYRYVLKNGTVQDRTASVHIEEMARGYKWWPFPVHVRRSIDVRFSGEVGEGTGSWKGGCTGCSYDLRDGESPEDALRRMERERKFDR